MPEGDVIIGFGVSGGVEVVLHSANRVLSECHDDGSLSMFTVDLFNGFNLIYIFTLLHEVILRCPSISL